MANRVKSKEAAPRRPRVIPVFDEDLSPDDAEAMHDRVFDDGALDIASAVRFSGIPRSNLFNLISDGTLASVKLGKKRLIAKRALVELLKRGFAAAVASS